MYGRCAEYSMRNSVCSHIRDLKCSSEHHSYVRWRNAITCIYARIFGSTFMRVDV